MRGRRRSRARPVRGGRHLRRHLPGLPAQRNQILALHITGESGSLYDSVCFEDLAGRLYGLVIIFSDRLPADQVQWLHHVVEVGEYGLALEDLAAMLAYNKIVVTDQERGDIVALARQMGMDLGPSWPGPTDGP